MSYALKIFLYSSFLMTCILKHKKQYQHHSNLYKAEQDPEEPLTLRGPRAKSTQYFISYKNILFGFQLSLRLARICAKQLQLRYNQQLTPNPKANISSLAKDPT